MRQVYFLSDAHRVGIARVYRWFAYVPRRNALCILACTLVLAVNADRFRSTLDVALRLYRDVKFRLTHSYKTTRINLTWHEDSFLTRYSTKLRTARQVLLTAGYILFKRIAVYKRHVPDLEDIAEYLCTQDCVSAIQTVLHMLPRSVYEKFFINYIPGRTLQPP